MIVGRARKSSAARAVEVWSLLRAVPIGGGDVRGRGVCTMDAIELHLYKLISCIELSSSFASTFHLHKCLFFEQNNANTWYSTGHNVPVYNMLMVKV